MKKRLLFGAVGLLIAGSFYGRGEATERYADYIFETYGERVDVDVSQDWKLTGYKATFELETPPLHGTYSARTYGDGTIYDDVMPAYWVKEAETTLHDRLMTANVLSPEETVRANVPEDSVRMRDVTKKPEPTSIFELDPATFLGVSVMLHEDWNDTAEQKQRVLDVIRLLEDDVTSIHFSFDGTPNEDDDFTERYLNVSRTPQSGDPSFDSLQTIDDLNQYDRLYGFDEATFISEYRFDGTKIDRDTAD